VNHRFRLKRSADFKRVRRFGKSFAHPLVVLIALPNEQEQSRFGIAAGRSVGNAVDRNRAKRILRAALQPLIPSIQTGWDIILLARRPLAGMKCQDAQSALTMLLKRARLIRESKGDDGKRHIC
jgi:ribonuclease P protein component